MKINYRGNYEQIKLAVEDANDVLNLDTFYSLIAKCEKFNCSKKTASEVAEILKTTTLEVEVKVYKPKWIFSKVLGYFVKGKPNCVFLNKRKLYRDTGSITNTIIHEYVHAVDNKYNNKIIDFGHNCGAHKNTAPYVIGNIAEIIIDGYEINDIESELKLFKNVINYEIVDNLNIEDL